MAPHARIPIHAVLCDVHNTIFTPTTQRTEEYVKRVAQEVLGRFDIDAEEIAHRTEEIGLACADEVLEGRLPPAELWPTVNHRVFDSFGVSCSLEQGAEISRRVSGRTAYRITPQRREFFSWLLESHFPFRQSSSHFAVVASNGAAPAIMALLTDAGLNTYFDRIYSPESLGGATKPSLEYFGKLLEEIDVPAHQALMIGNSLFQDAVSSRFGMHALMFRNAPTAPMLDRLGAAGKLVWARSLNRARSLIEAHFVWGDRREPFSVLIVRKPPGRIIAITGIYGSGKTTVLEKFLERIFKTRREWADPSFIGQGPGLLKFDDNLWQGKRFHIFKMDRVPHFHGMPRKSGVWYRQMPWFAVCATLPPDEIAANYFAGDIVLIEANPQSALLLKEEIPGTEIVCIKPDLSADGLRRLDMYFSRGRPRLNPEVDEMVRLWFDGYCKEIFDHQHEIDHLIDNPWDRPEEAAEEVLRILLRKKRT